MAITATIGGTPRTEWTKINTCVLTGELNNRWSLHCQIEDNNRGYRPTKGQQIVIDEDGTTRFAGRIHTVLERAPEDGPIQFDIEATDYNEVLYRRLSTATYQNRSLYEIVLDIVATALSGEGVTTANVDAPSPVVTISQLLRFDHVPVAQVFERLTELTGYTFYIDFTNDLHCSLFAANAAPFSLTAGSENWKDIDIRRSDEHYVNRQHVRGAATVNRQVTDTIVAIDGQWQFPTTALIIAVISVTRDSGAGPVAETFIGGPKPSSFPAGWAAGYDWAFYNDMYAFELDRVDMGADIDAGDIVVITYNTGMPLIPGGPAVGPNVATADDYAEQTARAALEGGSGIHEAIEEQPDISEFDTLQAFADGRLRQRGVDVATILVRVLDPGLLPAQRLTINIPKHALNDVYLITRTVYTWQFAADEDFFFVDVECTDGEPTTGGLGYLAALVQMARMGLTPIISGQVVSGETNLVVPQLTDFAWVNQTSGGVTATAVQVPGGIDLETDALAGISERILKKAIPVAPYMVTAAFQAFMTPTTNQNMGLVLRDSASGKLSSWSSPYIQNSAQAGAVQVKLASATGGNAGINYQNNGIHGGSGIVMDGVKLWWTRIADDGVSRKFYLSFDGGKTWVLVYSILNSDYIIPDEIGFYVDAQTALAGIRMVLRHWEEVAL